MKWKISLIKLKNHLPDLQATLLFLYSKQNEYFNSKYPKRYIDTVLEGFAKEDAITDFH